MSKLITYLPESQTFFLQAANSTYVIKIHELGFPLHIHWGATVAPQSVDNLVVKRDRSFGPNVVPGDRLFSLDGAPQECPVYGTSDFRQPAVEVFQPVDGSRILDLRYKSHRIESGKPALEGLPATFVNQEVDAETLILELEDKKLGLTVELLYSVFAAYPVLTRSTRFVNRGKDSLNIRRALSSSVDFTSSFAGYQFLQLSGAWARERDVIVTPLRRGVQSVDSKRGVSSHQQNPFFALTELGANEEHGNVFGFNLVYSGNFLATVERDSHDCVRAQIGINPFDFDWQLDAGATFQTPEAVMVYSPNGLGEMSRQLHRFYRAHLLRGEWKDKERPILVNNWEATYFDFNAEKLERIAKAGADIGLELFVLDDGWFGRRNDDRTSLGDWVVDRNKLPNGLTDLGQRVNGQGMKFGLWFEPEMISPDSDLYRAHPDWCIHVPDRQRTEGRSQYILDISRPEVREEIQRSISTILREAPIAYVKWDMNRHMTECGSAALPPSRQQETAHRFVLGLYSMMDYFTKEFPHILFEGCSGGGGRFDAGILYYMPQIWASDNSDAICRLRVQYGTSLAYPLSSICAHVSVVPNHQVGRVTPFRTRGHVAMTGAFGYEMDLSALSAEDRAEAIEQVKFYKQVRGLLMNGDLYRLKSPFTSNESAWVVVAADQSEAVATHVTILCQPSCGIDYVTLRGLDPKRSYRVVGTDAVYRGDLLMQCGLPITMPTGDFFSEIWHLKAV